MGRKAIPRRDKRSGQMLHPAEMRHFSCRTDSTELMDANYIAGEWGCASRTEAIRLAIHYLAHCTRNGLKRIDFETRFDPDPVPAPDD